MVNLNFGNRQPNQQQYGTPGLTLGYSPSTPMVPAPVNPAMSFVAPSTGSPMAAISAFSDPLSGALGAIPGLSGVNDIAAGAAPTIDPTGQAGRAGLMGGISGLLKGTFGTQDADGNMTGLNMDNLMSAIGAIGGIWGASKQLGLAKDSLNFQKETFRTNTENQRKSYNTAIEDRARSRYSESNTAGQATADDYIKRNRL